MKKETVSLFKVLEMRLFVPFCVFSHPLLPPRMSWIKVDL